MEGKHTSKEIDEQARIKGNYMAKKKMDQATYLKTAGKSTNQSMHLPFLGLCWLSDLS